jgi:hypothetical protein
MRNHRSERDVREARVRDQIAESCGPDYDRTSSGASTGGMIVR